MTSHDLKAMDRAHLWHPYTRFSTLEQESMPLIVRGEGAYLYDEDGKRYFDAISSWWCAALGHGQPKITAAIQKQAALLQHSILGNLSHPTAVELAGRLAHMMPTPDRHVLFASDGSCAVEQALKIIIQYWHQLGHRDRRLFICMDSAYHGDTVGSMSLGFLEAFHRPYQRILFPTIRVPFPVATSADPDGFAPALALLEEHKKFICGVVLEPLCQGSAGMRMYAPEWLRTMDRWCRANTIPIIMDEIATGFYRTGPRFAFERVGIDPDIVCVGKALAGGSLPLSATIVKDKFYNTFSDQPVDQTLQHGHTFAGNPIAAAAALAALDLFEELNIAGQVKEKADFFAASAVRLGKLPGVKNVRTLGMILALDLEMDIQSHPSGITRPHRIRLALKDRGILLRPLGPVLYIMPPLTTPMPDLEMLTNEIARAIETVQAVR